MKLEPDVTLNAIPDGPAGIRVTLKEMRNFTRSNKKDFVLRRLAMAIVQGVESKDWLGEADAVRVWVRENIRYVRDINGIETVADPKITLHLRQGDCDDHSVLVATLLETIGHPTRFVAIGFGYNDFSHVYTETKIGSRWVTVETTEPVGIGWRPSGIVSQMIEYN